MERKSYKGNGYLNSHFDSNRQKTKEGVGINCTKEMWEQSGFTVVQNDLDESGNMDYTKSDFYCYNKSYKLFVEAETKSAHLWKWVTSGLDIPARKYKYVKSAKEDGYHFIHSMVKGDGSEILITTEKYFILAAQSPYIKNVHSEFVIPEHGCYTIRKKCTYGNGVEYNDFFRIPYKYLKRRVKERGKWVIVK